jgi:hypothetical protein
MPSFRCDGCRARGYGVLKDSPVARGFCEAEIFGGAPLPTGCLYPNRATNERVKWRRK